MHAPAWGAPRLATSYGHGRPKGWYDDLKIRDPSLDRILARADRWPAAHAQPELVPVQTPLMVAGFSPGVVARMSEQLGPFGMIPVQAGGARGKGRAGDAPVEPGATLAVEMIKGDLDMAGVGTLSYRDGDRILGFGHPMFGTGVSQMPMAVGYVHHVFASQYRSFKLAAPVRTIGQLDADRYAAVGGQIGRMPKMIPCTVHVDGYRRLRYQFQVANDREWTPTLVEWAVEEAIAASEPTRGETMVRVRLQVHVDKRREPIVSENIYFQSLSPMLGLWRTTETLFLLTRNDFERVRITKAEARVTVREGRQAADIVAVAADAKKVKPGDTVRLLITLRPFGGGRVIKTAAVRVPPDTPPRTVITVDVCDALMDRALDRAAAPDKYRPRTLDQLIRLLREQARNTVLCVRTNLPKLGVTIEGEPHPSLPPAMLLALARSNATGIAPLRATHVQRIPTQWVLSGRQQIRIAVDKETVR